MGKPIELILATNEECPSDTLVDHLAAVVSILKDLSDRKFIGLQNSIVECFQIEKVSPIQMETMKNRWRRVLAHAQEILEDSSACEYWASKVAADGKLPLFNHRIHLMMI